MTMLPSLEPVALIFALNRRLFLNCLEGVDDAAAAQRPNDRTNSLAFLAAHLIDTRFFLLDALGVRAENPLAASLSEAQRIEDVKALPPVADLRSIWSGQAGLLKARLASVTEAELRTVPKIPVAVVEKTLFGMLVFLAQHESYHVGQMALVRKYLGYEAMSYRPRPGDGA